MLVLYNGDTEEMANLWVQYVRELQPMEKPGKVGWHAESALQRALAPVARADAGQPQVAPGQQALRALQSLPALHAHLRTLRLLQPPGTPIQSHKPASNLLCFRVFYPILMVRSLWAQDISRIKSPYGIPSSLPASWNLGISKPYACRQSHSCLWALSSPCRGCTFNMEGSNRLV